MPRSPLALAALATVAVPGMDAFDVRAATHEGDVDAAVVLDATGRRWVVRAPRDAAGGAALEAEVALLESLVVHVDEGRLPFDVPRPSGFAPLPEGGRAVVHPQLRGRPLSLEDLGPGPGLAAALGRAIAAVHELPPSTVEGAGMPVYEAEAYRQRRLAEVDEAARTRRVPPTLLRRWEKALEDVAMWRFQPTVVHGDLSVETVLCVAGEPTAVRGWAEARVADPADDLAWLLAAAPQEAVDPILEAYSLRRAELTDRHLAERALLAGELALARWLLHGVRTDDEGVVEDAATMLRELDEHTAVQMPPAQAGWEAPAAQHADGWVDVGRETPHADVVTTDGAIGDGPELDGLSAEGAGLDGLSPQGAGLDDPAGQDVGLADPAGQDVRPDEPAPGRLGADDTAPLEPVTDAGDDPVEPGHPEPDDRGV